MNKLVDGRGCAACDAARGLCNDCYIAASGKPTSSLLDMAQEAHDANEAYIKMVAGKALIPYVTYNRPADGHGAVKRVEHKCDADVKLLIKAHTMAFFAGYHYPGERVPVLIARDSVLFIYYRAGRNNKARELAQRKMAAHFAKGASDGRL